MEARIKATGEIIEVKVYKREHRLYIRIHGEKTGEIYRAKDLDFNINGKFVENCLNGIKQGIDYNPDYWTRLEHTYAGMAMQGLMSYVEQITPKEGRSFCDEIVDISLKVAHALVEKYKKEE